MASHVAEKVCRYFCSSELVSIFEFDFMPPPVSADIDLTIIAIINDIKYNGHVVLDLMDKFICEYSELSFVIKVEPMAKVHASHFYPPSRCPFFARTLLTQ